MKRQQIFLWTGGRADGATGCEGKTDALPVLPAPAPLRRAVLIAFQWGETLFKIAASACSVRTIPWGDTQMTWLHCKARPIPEITFDEPTTLMTVLFPAQYVVRIEPGVTFRITQARPSEDDLGVFPPNQPTPTDALPLAEVERVLNELLTPERN